MLARLGLSAAGCEGGALTPGGRRPQPLVRRGVESIVEQVAALPGVESVGITTNGMLLERKLPALVRAGLTSVNVSLDTLVAAKFEFITRRRGHDRVLRAVDAALEAGVQTVKINCVVMRGVNDDELSTFVELTRRRPVEVRFIEYMPFSDNAWKEASFLPYGDMLRSVTEVYPSLRKEVDGPHDTAKSYRVPGFAGTLGFISSMSDNFCAGCNRVRLTADGNLKVCLFGTEEVSLRDPLRAGAGEEQLAAIIAAALGRKHAVLGGHGDRHGIAASSENRPMILIGG